MGKPKVYQPIHSTSFNEKDDPDLINLFNDIGRRKQRMKTKTAVRDVLCELRDVILGFMDTGKIRPRKAG